MQNNSEANNDKIEKQERELEEDSTQERAHEKVLKDTKLGERTSDDESASNRQEEMLSVGKDNAEKAHGSWFDEWMAESNTGLKPKKERQRQRRRNRQRGARDDRVKKSAIAYAYLADGTRTTPEDLEVPE
jgi:hypothetical protein